MKNGDPNQNKIPVRGALSKGDPCCAIWAALPKGDPYGVFFPLPRVARGKGDPREGVFKFFFMNIYLI